MKSAPQQNDRYASAVYEGVVTHRRHTPHAHAFSYRMAQLYLDLDEVEDIFRDRWLWSVNRRNLAQWRRSDYMGPAKISLADAVRRCVFAQTGHTPAGPIRLLTHLRYAGVIFNPVSFYYCYQADGVTLDCIVAEITNTPWRERHAYVLPVASAEIVAGQDALRWRFDKCFHVSPFMPMERRYDWRFIPPAAELQVQMRVIDITNAEHAEFDAALTLQRRPLNSASLARVLWRYPLMTAQIIGAIHWQALRLWIKRNPIHDHPRHRGQQDSAKLRDHP
jgi:DUF1365 family protein